MRWQVVIAGLAGAAAVGCGGSGGSGSSSSGAPTIRYFNSVPDSTALDFRLDEAPTSSTQSIPYGGSSSSFTSMSAAEHDVDFLEHAQTQPLWSEADTFSTGTDYVAVAVGEEGYGSEFLKRPQLVVAPVDRSVPNGSKSRLFIVNGLIEAPGVPTPAIDFANPGQNPQFTTGANPIPPASGAEMVIDSGSEEFIARETGTQGSYVDKTFSFASGGVYLMLVTGIVGSGQAPDIKQIQLQTRLAPKG